MVSYNVKISIYGHQVKQENNAKSLHLDVHEKHLFKASLLWFCITI